MFVSFGHNFIVVKQQLVCDQTKCSESTKGIVFRFPAEWTFTCVNKRQDPAILQMKRQETARKNIAQKTSLWVHFTNANENK